MTKKNNNYEDYLLDNHFLRYQDYSEIYLSSRSEDVFDKCLGCSSPKIPITFLLSDEYHLPCWNCVSSKKGQRNELMSTILWNIKDIYSRILGDRYFQLFIIDDIYFRSTLHHDYKEFKSILSNKDLPSRDDIWFLDFVPGYPKTICMDNLEGMVVKNLSNIYEIESDLTQIRINGYTIDLPEMIPYDVKHHSRSNLMNKHSDRRTKKLRLSTMSTCIRFFNTSDDNVKSIFQVKKDGLEIDVCNLNHIDYILIKLAILRNKNFVRRIYEIIYEIITQVGVFRDGVFLKNTITLDPTKILGLEIGWTVSDISKKSEFINISIL